MLDSEGRGAAVSQGWAGTPFLPPFSCSGSRTSRVLRTLALSRCFCSTTDGMEGEHSFIRLPVSGNAYKSSTVLVGLARLPSTLSNRDSS